MRALKGMALADEKFQASKDLKNFKRFGQFQRI
jgi:hypothetical protein